MVIFITWCSYLFNRFMFTFVRYHIWFWKLCFCRQKSSNMPKIKFHWKEIMRWILEVWLLVISTEGYNSYLHTRSTFFPQKIYFLLFAEIEDFQGILAKKNKSWSVQFFKRRFSFVFEKSYLYVTLIST